jgi:serine/threonine protein kinase
MSREKPPSVQLAVGVVLKDRYRVTTFLGAGGFAAVYEAEDQLIGRPVAIKVLNILGLAHNPALLERTLERFRREARAAARVAHPNIVTIHDMGVTEALSQPFIVMERLYGHDLADELHQHGPVDPARLLPLLQRALQGLWVGHQQGIIHKDLKPSNLFLHHPRTPHEDIRVVDFGIARVDAGPSELTGTGQVFGTPQYLAPEYINQQLVTPALDVYQMGLILVEALTGAPVVNSEHAIACVMTHSHGELPLPLALLESPLGEVIARALEHDPERRYANALEMAEALARMDPAQIPRAAPGPLRSLREISGNLRGLSAPNHPPDTQGVPLPSPRPAPPTPPTPAPLPAPAPPWERAEGPRHDGGVGPLLLVGGAVVALLVISALSIGALAWLNQAPAAPAPSPAPAPTLVEDAPPSAPAPAPPPKPAPAPAPVEATPAPALAASIQVEVVALPEDAQIMDGELELGRGAAALRFASPTAPPYQLTVRARGHLARALTVGPQQGPRVEVRLERAAPPPAPHAAQKPPRPRPPKPPNDPSPVIID